MKKSTKQRYSSTSLSYFMNIDNKVEGSINHPKNTRIIYTIDKKLSKEEIEKIITNCEIEFFSIDTTSFEKVTDYYEMIDDIKEIREKYLKNIGIIAELKGRKIKVDNLSLRNGDKGVYNLNKGDIVKVHHQESGLNAKKHPSGLKMNENSIAVKFKDIHKLVKKDDSIIINDNKGCLKVLGIREAVPKPKSMVKLGVGVKAQRYLGATDEEHKHQRKYSEITNAVNQKHSSCQDVNAVLSSKLSITARNSMTFGKTDCPFSGYKSTNTLCLVEDPQAVPTSSQNMVNILQTENVINLQNEENYSKSERVSERDEYENLYEEYDVMLTGEDEIKDEYRYSQIDRYLRATSRRYTIKIDNEDEEKELSFPKPNDSLGLSISGISQADDTQRRRRRLCSKISNKTYEIVCQVEYDCKINKNSFLYVPNVDYAALDIDVLSPREVSEINDLDEKGVDFICISIKTMKDIESIRDINSNIKIIASIPDYTSLEEIHQILMNTCGIVISRTFQIFNHKTKYSINKLTSYLIAKCREHGKPIYSYLDINHDLFCQKKKKAQVSEVMYNIIDGMDGFIINIQPGGEFDCAQTKEDFNFTIESLKYFTSYFERINNDKYFIKNESMKGRNSEKFITSSNSPYGVVLSIVKKYDMSLDNSFIAYIGEEITDIENISRLKLNSPLVVFSSDKVFINHAQLFYSVITVEEIERNKTCFNIITESLRKKFKNKNIILVKNDKSTKKISVKLIS